MSDNLKKRTLSGLVWQFMERCGSQGVQFVISVVLARLLTPEDFGIIGLLTVFVTIANVFVEGGFGASLVQKKDSDDTDFSTVFFFSLGFSGVLYVILFFAAPLIASFYNEPILTNMVRVMALSLFMGAINTVQKANVSKRMQFKKFFFATISGTIASAVVGISMAYMGFGAWALIGQHLSKQVFDTIVLWFISGWRPKWIFSFVKLKRLFSFGWKILCSSLIDSIYNNIYSLIIGKFYSSADLGYYNKGKSYSYLIIENINTSINNVLFPVISSVQENLEKVKAITRRAIKTSTFIIFPAMSGIAAIATPLIKLMLTEKWLPCVPYLQFCCFSYAFWPVHTANLQAIKAMGRSDVFLKLEIIKKITGVIILVVTIPHGLYIMMVGRCVSTVLSSVINAFPNKKLLNYSYFEQVKDIMPAFLLSVVMVFVVLMVGRLNINMLPLMIIQIIAGALVYILGAKFFKLEALEYCLRIIKRH